MQNSPQISPWKATLFAGLAVGLVFAIASLWQFFLCEIILCNWFDTSFHHSREEDWRIVIVATLSAIGALLALCPLALRIINERNRALEEVKRRAAASQEMLGKALSQQNDRFDLALENLVQGVCMFNGEQRLIVSNQRYATMYGLPADLMQPGVTLREILEYRIANGLYGEGSPEAYIDERMAWVTSGIRSTKIQQLSDGRSIEIVHQPMSDGGWLTTHEDITERRKAEAKLQIQYRELHKRDQALRDQNERFDAALNNMSQGLCMFDGAQRLIVSNRRYADMYGLSEEQMATGMTFREILELRIDNENYGGVSPEQYIEERMSAIGERVTSQKSQRLTDGRTILISHCPMLDGGWLATHEDISERKNSADLLRAVIDSFPGGIAAYDANLVLRIVNRNYHKVLDIPQDRYAVGTHVADIALYNAENGRYGPGDAHAIARARVAELRKFERYSIERRRPDGTVLELQGFPLPEGGGFVSTCIDITERKRVEEALKQSEELFSKAFQKSPIPLSISRPDGTIHNVNEAWLTTLGYTRDEAIGNSSVNLGIWSDPSHRAHFVASLKKDDVVTRYETRYRSKGGELIDMLVSGEYVEVGGEPHMFNLSHDVTESNKAKKQLVDHRDQLQGLVNEATAELKSKAERLEISLVKEKELNELQRQFVSMASHEFRTPLAVIDGMVQRLIRRKDKITPEDLVERAMKIRSAVQTMTTLMESTLSAARMDAGKIEINVAKCDLQKLISEVCARQRQIGKKHNIICDLKGLPEYITGDETALNQVFTNLLSNACKYSSEVTDIMVKGWTAGANAMVSVQDTGLGIDEEDLPKMFTRFFRAKTSTGIPGTGIGLNLVQTLVELHNGSITLESTKEVGSTFTVCLPVNAQAPDRQGETRAA